MRRQQLTEAQIAALFDPPTDRRELVRHCVRHQRWSDRLGGLRKGGFPAHRSHRRSEDETEIRAEEGTAGTLFPTR
jgi:hypothetical protein